MRPISNEAQVGALPRRAQERHDHRRKKGEDADRQGAGGRLTPTWTRRGTSRQSPRRPPPSLPRPDLRPGPSTTTSSRLPGPTCPSITEKKMPKPRGSHHPEGKIIRVRDKALPPCGARWREVHTCDTFFVHADAIDPVRPRRSGHRPRGSGLVARGRPGAARNVGGAARLPGPVGLRQPGLVRAPAGRLPAVEPGRSGGRRPGRNRPFRPLGPEPRAAGDAAPPGSAVRVAAGPFGRPTPGSSSATCSTPPCRGPADTSCPPSATRSRTTRRDRCTS